MSSAVAIICQRFCSRHSLGLLYPALHHCTSPSLKAPHYPTHSGCHGNGSWSRSLHERRGSGRGQPRSERDSSDRQPFFRSVSQKENKHQSHDLSENDSSYEDTDSGYHSDTETNGLHEPVMLDEVLSFFAPKENQVFVDMTFGGGGHTRALLKSAPGVKVYALDRDPDAFQLAQRLSQYHRGCLYPMHGRFSEMRDLLNQRGLGDCSVDGILIDAGCSSFQFDSPHRGFSLSRDGPLDMRMDGDRFSDVPTAADVVNSVDFATLVNILRTYGEESHGKKVAQAIIDYRTNFRPFSTTQELATVVACCFSHRQAKSNLDKVGRRAHTATKTFQALRIFVNNELNELVAGLDAAREVLRPGGKLAVLSFHSLEDRIVKRSIQGRDVAEKGTSLRNRRLAAAREEEDGDSQSAAATSAWRTDQKKVLLPDENEIDSNPRARSAKLRTAIKA